MSGAGRALLALLLLAACEGAEGLPQVVEVGRPAPAYAAASLASSDSASLRELRGRVVLLNVWATWCPPCREEIPALQEIHERYVARGLDVVGVTVDAPGEEEAVREFVDDYGMTYPVWLDPADRVSTTFRLTGVPSTFLIGRDGTLLWKHLGPIVADDPALTKLLEEALAEG